MVGVKVSAGAEDAGEPERFFTLELAVNWARYEVNPVQADGWVAPVRNQVSPSLPISSRCLEVSACWMRLA